MQRAGCRWLRCSSATSLKRTRFGDKPERKTFRRQARKEHVSATRCSLGLDAHRAHYTFQLNIIFSDSQKKHDLRQRAGPHRNRRPAPERLKRGDKWNRKRSRAPSPHRKGKRQGTGAKGKGHKGAASAKGQKAPGSHYKGHVGGKGAASATSQYANPQGGNPNVHAWNVRPSLRHHQWRHGNQWWHGNQYSGHRGGPYGR